MSDNVSALVKIQNLPFSLKLGEKDFTLKELGQGHIFELVNILNTRRQKENNKFLLSVLEGEERAKAIKDIKVESTKFVSVGDIFSNILTNITFNDIVAIISYAISVFNKISFSDAEQTVKDAITTDNFIDVSDSAMKVLGVDVSVDTEKKTEPVTVAT